MTDARASLEVGAQVGAYVIEERIGAGGFGEVFRARHPRIGSVVAIKILHAKYSADPDAVMRFITEARAVNRISHPGIVEISDFGQLEDGREYCVMELIRGTTLRDVLRERTRIPLDEALPILRAIAEAVDVAHAAGIAHRDLKPDNVFVLDGGGIKLIDFGLAKLANAEAPVTQTGAAFGTPLYMSPEQCRGRAVDARTDAYSFGVLAYHVLTGELPFTGDALEIALHHLNDPPDPPSQRCAELSSRVDRVVLALLAKDPADRPTLLAPAIAAIAGDAVLPHRTRRPTRRMTRFAIGLLAAAGVGGVLWRIAGEDPAPIATLDPGCARAQERLVGVWDISTRATIRARFDAVQRVEVPGTWRAVTRDLDGYAARWATQWGEACRATDARTDPLLHAQRTTCLENALLDLRGITNSLATEDVATFAEGWNGIFLHASLADCASTAVLRAQGPAPPPENRDQVAELMMSVHRARAMVRRVNNAGRPGGLDEAIAKIDELAGKLEALRSPGANAAWWIWASYLQISAAFDPMRRDLARRAIERAISRADASRDDQALAADYDTLARLELDSGALAHAERALSLADAALVRSGMAEFPRRRLAVTHAHFDAARGRIDDALKRFEGVTDSEFAGTEDERSDRVALLSRAGKHADAVRSQRAVVEAQRDHFGENHWMTVKQYRLLAVTLARAGDLMGALAEVERALIIDGRLRASPAKLADLRTMQLDLAIRLGRTELAEQVAVAVIRGEPDSRPLGIAERLVLAGDAFTRGALETTREQLRHIPPADTGPLRPRADELRAVLDMISGDLSALAQHAQEVGPLDATTSIDALRIQPWLLAIFDAASGRRALADARLARLAPVHTSTTPIVAARAYLYDGVVLAVLGRWAEAVTAFEKARALPIWSRDHGLAEIDAWLGLARREAGDLRGALEPLEESLDILSNCCDGFAYFAPDVELALARVLWDTGDRVRARFLAGEARDHYARLGPFKERLVLRAQDRDAAIRWLDEHTAAQAVNHAAQAAGCSEHARSAPGKHTLYINTEGVSLTNGAVDDSRTNTSTLVKGDRAVVVPPFLVGVDDRASRIAAIVATAQTALARYSIDLVTTRPQSGTYRMIVLGGEPSLVAIESGAWLVAVPDCAGSNRSTIGIVFDRGIHATHVYAGLVLGELGAMVGMSLSTLGGDCTCRYLPHCALTFDDTKGTLCTFSAAAPRRLDQPHCGGTPTQDEPALLAAAFGCR